jgi:hypothetical protein
VLLLLLILFVIFTSGTFAQSVTPISTTSTNIIINEYMPDASPEWVELQNNNNFDVSISGWTIEDAASNIKTIPSKTIPANGYFSFDIAGSYLNNDGDTFRIKDSLNIIVDSASYTSSSPSYSWSKNTSWCLTASSKDAPNNSCYVSPTPIPTNTTVPSNTPIPTSTQVPSSTPYPTSTPIPTLKPTTVPTPTIPLVFETPVIEPTPQLIDIGETKTEQTLGITDMITPTPTEASHSAFSLSPTLISTLFIIVGLLLLIIPFIIVKLKK